MKCFTMHRAEGVRVQTLHFLADGHLLQVGGCPCASFYDRHIQVHSLYHSCLLWARGRTETFKGAAENPMEAQPLTSKVILVKLFRVSETVSLVKVRILVCRRQWNQTGVREVTGLGLEIAIPF